jgi:PAS domain S-box-containing protein
MSIAVRILIVENNPSDVEFIRNELKKGSIHYVSETVQTETEYRKALNGFIPDVILSDYALPKFNGDAAFEIRNEIAPDTPFIFVSGTVGEEKSIEYIKNGVTDYVLKDKLYSLTVKVKRALKDVKEKKEKKAAEDELKRSEKLFRALIEKSKDMITLGNREGELVYGSPFITDALGYPPADLINMRLYDVVHPDDIPELRKSRDKLLKEPGGSFSFQHRRRHKDGRWIWCEGTVTNLLDEPGINAMLTNFRDISERKKAEQDILDANKNLKKALTDLQKIMDASLDIICSMDEEGTFISVSKASFNILGYHPEELVGRDYIDFVVKEDVDKTGKTESSIMEGFPVTTFENRYTHKNGNIVDILWSSNWDPNDKIFYCIAKDITERKKAEKQQEFDRNNLDALINNTNDHMWSVDRHLNLITFNQQFNRVAMQTSGRKIEKGTSVLALHFPAEFEERYKRAFAGENFTEIDHIITAVERWIEISFYPIRERDEVVGTACYARDITEEKVAERQLSKSEAFSRGILDALSSHISVIDHRGNIIRANESWTRYAAENGAVTLERSAEGANYLDVCERSAKAGDQIAAEALHGIRDVIAGKTLFFYFEYPCHSPARQEWFGMRVTKFESYEPMVVISHLDITVRKLAEENLKYSEAKLKEAQAIAHLGNFESDVSTNSDKWSDEMYDILGVNKDEVTPSRELVLSFIHPDDIDAVRTEMEESLRTTRNSDIYFRFIRKDRSIRYGYVKAIFDVDINGALIRVFGVFQDVTEQKLAELERTKMVSDLMQRNKDLEQFAYIISHNLRAPIANIIGASGLLNDPDLTAQDKEVLNKGINNSVLKLDEVVQDLNFILQSKGEVTEPKEIIYFSELVEHIKISIINLIDKYGIQIKYDFTAANEMATIKPYLYSIFYNLISNSVKYRRQHVNCVIEIKSSRVKNNLMLTFTDNGRGINLGKNRGQVFGLYKRFHTDVEGKGMGLFMVKTQVEILGGKIHLKSVEDEGTEINIQFEL